MKSSSKATQSVDVTCSCSVCDAVALRDEKLLDALQTARFVMNCADGIRDMEVKLARARAAVDEALKLMQPKRW